MSFNQTIPIFAKLSKLFSKLLAVAICLLSPTLSQHLAISTSETTPTTFEEILLIKLLCITKWKSNFRYFGSEWFESKWFLGSLVNQINQMRAGLLLYKCGQERAEREINYDGSLGKRIFYTLRMKLPNGLKYIFQMFTWYPLIKKCKIFFAFLALALKYDGSFRCLRCLHCARSLCLALTTDIRLPLR